MTDGLQQQIIEYLESKGWYFDWDHVEKNLTWYSGDPREEILREAHAWTVPQWDAYWSADHQDDSKPKRRRYEKLQDALWSQLLREEEPNQFGVFFDDEIPERTTTS